MHFHWHVFVSVESPFFPVWLCLFVVGEGEIVEVCVCVLALLNNAVVIDVFDEFQGFFVSVH